MGADRINNFLRQYQSSKAPSTHIEKRQELLYDGINVKAIKEGMP
jgi:hypothetical protein